MEQRSQELHLAPAAPFVLGHEPARGAFRDDTLHVRVPPLRHVALRSDECMLARRMQHRVAERAHVACGLEVLRGAQRPPARLHGPDDTQSGRSPKRETGLECRRCQ